MAAARKSVALKTWKLRLVCQLRRDPRDYKGAKHATGHVYLQNLRTKLPTLTTRQIKDHTPAAYASHPRDLARSAA